MLSRVVAPGIAFWVAMLANPLAAVAASPLRSHVEIAGQRFNVEVADTSAARARGLMYRKQLPADNGMLFVYRDAAPRYFWMENTLIPLDILFFDARRRLINISVDTPPCKRTRCPTYASAKPAQYVLELNAGTAKRLRVRPGDTLTVGH